MGFLIFSALLVQTDIDWSQFETLINETIPVTKDLKSFRKNLDDKIREFKKEHKFEEGDLAYDVLKIQNSNLYLLQMGWFPDQGCMYVVNPSGLTYSVEEVAGFSDFKAYSALLEQNHLVLAGSEYAISNAKHPAVVTYRHRSGWVVSGVQVADFEGSTQSFVKKGNAWTCYASGRTYPKHFGVAHSGAHVSMQRTFVVKNGELLTSHDEFYPSLMHTYDELVGSTLRKNWAKVRSLCASDSVAKKMRRLTENSSQDHWKITAEDSENWLKCRIADSDWVGVMERVGKAWKLTKFERFKEDEAMN